MIKHKIRTDEDLPVLEWHLTESKDKVYVECIASDGCHYYVFEFQNDGTYKRVSHISSDIGLSLNNEGKIKEDED